MSDYFALPARAYASEPRWIHPHFGLQRKLLDGRSAFRRSCQAAWWMVDGAAQAAAFRDPRYGEVGLVGLVHFLPGRTDALARALEAAEAWLAERGAGVARVPVAGHVLYGFGFLADGFDQPPVVGTAWTRPEELEATVALGYRVARRFLNYRIDLAEALEVARRTPVPGGVEIRPVRRLRFREGILTLARLRNETFSALWGDAPMSDAEAWELLRRMWPVYVPDFALLAFAEGKPVGMTLAFPDYNEAFAPLRREPRGPRAAWALARHRRFRRGALGEVGVVASHRGRGIAAALVARVVEAMAARGYRELHYLLVLEDNVPSRRTAERFGGRVVSSHVVCEKPLR